MIAYTTVGTNDYEKAKGFYDSLFAEIGVGQLWSSETFTGYGADMNQPMFAVCKPHDGQAATAGNGTMISLACPDAATVDKVYKKAISLGAQDEGEAGPRGDAGFYIGYFRDLDSNKIAAFAMVTPG